MRKFFAVAMGSLVALVGFASTANASSTVDLIWIDVSNVTSTGAVICLRPLKRDCPRLGTTVTDMTTTDNITLAVIITAGAAGSRGGGMSVDYSDALPKLSVIGYQSLTTTVPFFYLPLILGTTSDTGTAIDLINAAAAPPLSQGIGLPSGATAYLGTVSFHQDQIINGTSEIFPGVFGPSDGLVDNNGVPETATVFNSAFVVNVPEPGALSLLVMGLGGMLLAGRGRRS